MVQRITVFDEGSLIAPAVIQSLSRDYDVRIASTNPSLTSQLQSEHVTSHKVNLDDVRSIEAALEGSYGVFLTTTTDFTCPEAYKKELTHGKNMAEACEAARMRHVVYVTQLSVVRTTGLCAQHMDSKADIEAYMKHLQLPLTSLILPVMCEELLDGPLRPRCAGPNLYQLGIPMGQLPLDLLSVQDVGEAARTIFCLGEQLYFKTLSLTGDKLSVRDMASILSKYMGPKTFKDRQVTVDQFRQASFPGAEDMAAMFDFYTRVDQRASVDTTKRLCPKVQSFPEWVHSNVDKIHRALDIPKSPERDIWA